MSTRFADVLLENIQNIQSIVLSAPLRGEIKRIDVRPVVIKGKTLYQISETRGVQIFHANLTEKELIENLVAHQLNFKQTRLVTVSWEFLILTNKKGASTIVRKAIDSSNNTPTLTHNRQKIRILKEGTPIDFLIRIGVMNSEGKVLAEKSKKFKQINRLLEMLQDIFPYLEDSNRCLNIVDFGCGKAYLTFALYYYFSSLKGMKVQITGLDLKKEVIADCQQIADDLGYSGLHFRLGDISSYQSEQGVDMVFSLHACDTATDAALYQAIRWNAKVIMCVPCCQHELFSQLKNQLMQPILKHGILKERFSALLTDALRAELLESQGYSVDVIEFIDLEHTPKNILIRGIKKKGSDEGFDCSPLMNLFSNFHSYPSLAKWLGIKFK